MQPDTLKTDQNRTLAYHKTDGAGPGVVFLGGLKSDMEGTKALHLEAWARREGRAFLRFDYSGHGQSSGAFTEGCIGDWAEDARAAITALTAGPQVLVGSSMGGWIACLVARACPGRVAGLVGIAAAPDFTEDSMWAGFSEADKARMMEEGQVALPSDYGDPYIITRRMIEDGRNQLVLRSPLRIDAPVRLLQGTADADVEMSVALRLLAHLEGPDIVLELVKGADHRFSDDACLSRIVAAVEDVLAHA
ncbi:alpha/beta fold hydrolase [Alterinioella nitratireducens]|uniref:alpha/beta fold hydrolase n=1 Tax=Alterinioella nitratireducens TaxID=2735915 RepID=UPI004057D72E